MAQGITIRAWYDSRTLWQKRYLFIWSLLLVMVFGIGLIPLSALIYLQLGQRVDSGYRLDPRNSWYSRITSGQKIFLYFLSSAGVLVFGIGLIPLALLIYWEIAVRDPNNVTDLEHDVVYAVEAGSRISLAAKAGIGIILRCIRDVSSTLVWTGMVTIPLTFIDSFLTAESNKETYIFVMTTGMPLVIAFIIMFVFRSLSAYLYKKVTGLDLVDGRQVRVAAIVFIVIGVLLFFTSVLRHNNMKQLRGIGDGTNSMSGLRGGSPTSVRGAGAAEKVATTKEGDVRVIESVQEGAGFQGIEMRLEFVEFLAESSNQTFLNTYKQQLLDNGYSLDAMPKLETTSMVTELEGVKLGVASVIVESLTADGLTRSKNIMIFGLDGSTLKKVLCIRYDSDELEITHHKCKAKIKEVLL